ncbi:GvpL/GvpF family gas vesicle protein [Bacillus sp. UNC41MFS5]|uniref:GvpL/GvpF family gas vesicle protein n=1 Tax=Bacillus sp. UNC41MFS5 TaxID=1449046 RepID=UPI00047B1C68|nr:GvpL/GvpF family gas vesicle protein [Bacillus sp. UNC41MFS5]
MTHTKATTDFIYMYGVILAEELQSLDVPAIKGIDQKTVTLKIFKDFAAVITPVNAQNFSQEQIDLQLKNADWLKEKAFHHHEIISIIHQQFTILPMSFCTIFQNESNLESLLADQYGVIYQKLLTLKDKQEWNLKVFCNNEKALSFVLQHNEAVLNLRDQLASMPKGKQFLMKKKLEHLIHSQLEVEQSKWWNEIKQQLTSIVSEINIRQNWGKEVTERKDEMIVNCDFLIDQSVSESFMNKVTVIEKIFEPLGCIFQVTGPWPPYHFSKMTKEIL